jgi:hypothetical protein
MPGFVGRLAMTPNICTDYENYVNAVMMFSEVFAALKNERFCKDKVEYIVALQNCRYCRGDTAN